MFRFTLVQLSYFATVAEHGSIVESARKLNTASSSISKAILHLEAEFGVKLFVRHHAHGMRLTTNGERILREVHGILKKITKLTGVTTEISETTSGPISVGCMLTFAQIIFPALRKEYESSYPNVQLRQFELNHKEIIDCLRESKIEVAIAYDLVVPADMKFLSLVDLPPYAVVSESHMLAGKQTVSANELTEHRMVLLDLPHTSDYVFSLFKQNPANLKIAERTGDPALRSSLVANGFGYSITNFKPLSTQSPDGKSLRFIPIEDPERVLSLGLMTTKSEVESSLVRSFVNHSSESIKSGYLPGLKI